MSSSTRVASGVRVSFADLGDRRLTVELLMHLVDQLLVLIGFLGLNDDDLETLANGRQIDFNRDSLRQRTTISRIRYGSPLEVVLLTTGTVAAAATALIAVGERWTLLRTTIAQGRRDRRALDLETAALTLLREAIEDRAGSPDRAARVRMVLKTMRSFDEAVWALATTESITAEDAE